MPVKIGCPVMGGAIPILERMKLLIPEDVELVFMDGMFEKLKQQAMRMERENAVDVFMSRGSNAAMLKESTSIPTVVIEPSEFDILLIIDMATRHHDVTRVGFISYKTPFAPIRDIAAYSGIDIVERVFEDKDTLRNSLLALKLDGVQDIMGGYLACELAGEVGLRAYPLSTDRNYRSAIFHAIDIARAKRQEQIKAKQWNAILESAYDAIVSVNEAGSINLFNNRAQQLLEVDAARAMGKNASQILHDTHHEQVMQTKISQVRKIREYAGVQVLSSCTPILIREEVGGAVITFQSLSEVQRSEQKIRRRQAGSGFAARMGLSDIKGESDCLRQVRKNAARYAKTDATILLCGETGTGKEVFAQAIHNASARRGKPFVSVNCAALPTSLLESELFGYEEGAFTGARRGGKYGLFELAHTGTIFLDEIAEAPLEIQARLLRVLEERQLLRIGGEQVINVDVRVVAATNKRLPEMITQGLFREDLYYRINVLALDIPPLRRRREDIPLLLAEFLDAMRADLNPGEVQRITGHRSLLSYPWPGNVRQLRNVAERIAVLYRKGDSVRKLLGEAGIPQSAGGEAAARRSIEQALAQYRGNKTKAAASLGMSRTTLWRKVQEMEKDDQQ